MELTPELNELIRKIYVCVADSGRWGDFLEDLRGYMSAHSTAITFLDRRSPNVRIQESRGFAADALALYHERYAAIDPFVERGFVRGLLRPGGVFLAQDAISDVEFTATKFYKEFGQKSGYIGGLAAVILADDRVFALLGINRHPEQIFGELERELITLLLPHLRTALQIYRQMQDRAAIGVAAIGTLARLRTAVVLCRKDATVIHANASAEALLARNALVRTIAGRLDAAGPAVTKRIHRSIAAAAAASMENRDYAEAMTLREMAGGEPSDAVALITSVIQEPGNVPPEPIAAVLFNVQISPVTIEPVSFCELFGLTEAEARVARHVIDGDTVATIAQRLGISPHTVRTQLKSLFQKTNTHRQAELMRVLLTSIPG